MAPAWPGCAASRPSLTQRASSILANLSRTHPCRRQADETQQKQRRELGRCLRSSFRKSQPGSLAPTVIEQIATQPSVAFKAGGISFIGPVKSINRSSLVMSAPNGQTFTLKITPQTDLVKNAHHCTTSVA